MNVLAGKRVLVTRPRGQAAALIARLSALGAVPVIFPTIEIAPPEDASVLDQAIAGLTAYEWVVFTSVNGVSAFFQRMQELGTGAQAFSGVKVAAIGPATAQALQEQGIRPDFIPDEYVAEAILPGLGDVQGKRILLPRADIARKALVDALRQQGALPEEIAVYRTIPAQPDPLALQDLAEGIDIATFTSASTVRNFVAILGKRANDVLHGALIACIGPITAQAARDCGLPVDLTAEEYTIDGLVNALEAYLKRKKD